MKKVWILFYIDNEYNQPDRAFEKLYWEKPTHKQLEKYGFSKADTKAFQKPNRGGEAEYWVEEFSE